MEDKNYCYYSDLPSPMAYMEEVEEKPEPILSKLDIDRIIEMAWEDRTSFDAIRFQFGLTEDRVKALMKNNLHFGSYKRWRARVEACKTKHAAKRSNDITRFKCSRQRSINGNRIAKRMR